MSKEQLLRGTRLSTLERHGSAPRINTPVVLGRFGTVASKLCNHCIHSRALPSVGRRPARVRTDKVRGHPEVSTWGLET